MNNEQQRAALLAEQAKAVLGNDAYRAAWKELHEALMANLLSCEATDEPSRFAAWQAVRIARNLNGALSNMIETGESVKLALERAIDRQERQASARMKVV